MLMGKKPLVLIEDEMHLQNRTQTILPWAQCSCQLGCGQGYLEKGFISHWVTWTWCISLCISLFGFPCLPSVYERNLVHFPKLAFSVLTNLNHYTKNSILPKTDVMMCLKILFFKKASKSKIFSNAVFLLDGIKCRP